MMAARAFSVDAIVEIQSDGGRSSEDDAQQYPKDEDGGNSDHGCASRCLNSDCTKAQVLAHFSASSRGSE